MVSEEAGRGTRTARAELALKSLTADLDPRERLRRVLEQTLVFAGASVAAVYTPGDTGDVLCLVESAGVPRTLFGLRDSYPVDARSPAAVAHRTGRPVWLGPDELAECAESRRMPAGAVHLAALPIRAGAAAGDGGCLLALTERPGGFDDSARDSLGLLAEAVAWPAPPAASDPGELSAGAFSLAMDSGRVEVGDELLELFALDRADFDGKVETLLGLTVPEDLPSLMSVVEADHMSIGDRELEFRVLQPAAHRGGCGCAGGW